MSLKATSERLSEDLAFLRAKGFKSCNAYRNVILTKAYIACNRHIEFDFIFMSVDLRSDNCRVFGDECGSRDNKLGDKRC